MLRISTLSSISNFPEKEKKTNQKNKKKTTTTTNK